ncbi:YceI family protein [Falsiruegeria mediterranea]
MFRSFQSLLSVSAAAALFAASGATAAQYKTDQGHTEVNFGWSHAGVSMQSAEFTVADGTLDLDPENPGDAKLNVTIKTESLNSGFGPLDDHLKSKDFLEVATYPEITFTSTSVEVTGDKTANVTGDLTIHGTTQPVTLATELTHVGPHPLGGVIDYYKGEWVAFTAQTEIDHMAFGVGGFSTGPISISIVTEMKAAE